MLTVCKNLWLFKEVFSSGDNQKSQRTIPGMSDGPVSLIFWSWIYQTGST